MFVKLKDNLNINVNHIKYFYEVIEEKFNNKFYYLKIYFKDNDSMIVTCKNEKELNKFVSILKDDGKNI